MCFTWVIRIRKQFLGYLSGCLEMALVLQIKIKASQISYLIPPPLDEKTTRLSCRDKVPAIWYDAPKCIGVPGEAINLRIIISKLTWTPYYVIIVYILIFNKNVSFAYFIFLWLGNVLSGFKNDIKDKKCQEKACKVAKCQEHNKTLCHAHDWNRHLCH